MKSIEYITLDPETRCLEVPHSQVLFGVKDDRNAERKHFLFPRYVGDGVDLSECSIFINYRSTGGSYGTKLCDDVEVCGEHITFSWVISGNVLDGNTEPCVKFAVQAKKADQEGVTKTVFGTREATGTYFTADFCPLPVSEEYPDVIMDILERIENVETASGADGKSAYEIAVENGFSGTESEWLESLKGDPGEGAEPFTVNVSFDKATGTVTSADKTYEQVKSAYESGKLMRVILNGSIVMPFSRVVPGGGGGSGYEFYWEMMEMYYFITFCHEADGGITGEYGVLPAAGEGAKGEDGVSCTHSWNGTVLTVTSASGSSSADLKGEKGDPGEGGEPEIFTVNVALDKTTSTVESADRTFVELETAFNSGMHIVAVVNGGTSIPLTEKIVTGGYGFAFRFYTTVYNKYYEITFYHPSDGGAVGDYGTIDWYDGTGPQGPQGEKGDTGPQGPKGDKGDKGDTGPQGPQGPQGEKGEKGDKGDPGEGAEPFTVNVSLDKATGTVTSADKTYEQIKSAYESGKLMRVILNGSIVMPFSRVVPGGGGGSGYEFYWEMMEMYYFITFCHEADGGITGEYGELPEAQDGADGVGVASIIQSSVSSVSGEKNTATVTLTDGTTSTLTFYNGARGLTGPQGEKGEKGDTGAQGPQGPRGYSGSDGADGATGPQGPKGDKGDTGDTGPQGPKGDTGDTGPQGPKGDTGDTGPQGEKGDKGDTGEQGPQGPSVTVATVVSKTNNNPVASSAVATSLDNYVHKDLGTINASIRPEISGSYSCGTSSRLWTTVYAKNGTIQTSDRDSKDSIRYITDAASTPMTLALDLEEETAPPTGITTEDVLDFVRSLAPVTFCYKNNSTEEATEENSPQEAIQMGLIANDIRDHKLYRYVGIDRVESVEVTPEELDDDGNVITEAVYEEREVMGLQPIPLATVALTACKSLLSRVEELEAKVEYLMNR